MEEGAGKRSWECVKNVVVCVVGFVVLVLVSCSLWIVLHFFFSVGRKEAAVGVVERLGRVTLCVCVCVQRVSPRLFCLGGTQDRGQTLLITLTVPRLLHGRLRIDSAPSFVALFMSWGGGS